MQHDKTQVRESLTRVHFLYAVQYEHKVSDLRASGNYCSEWIERAFKRLMNSSRFTGEIKITPSSDSILIRFKEKAGALRRHVEGSIFFMPLY